MSKQQLYRTDSIQQIETHQSLLTLGHWMQEAANGVVAALLQYVPMGTAVGVVTGSGNNAGDGFLVACLLKQQGYEVTLYPAVPDEQLPPLAKQAAKEAKQQQIPRLPINQMADAPVAVWVDALFGIGLNSPLSDPWTDFIATLNQHHAPVISIDVPSGLNANTGQPWGIAVQAEQVVMVGLPKLGLYTAEAKAFANTLIYHPIEGMIQAAEASEGLCSAWSSLKPLWPSRQANAHKGNTGTVQCLGGQAGMAGAIILAAQAALKTGVGTLKVWTDPEHATIMNVQYPQWRTQGVSAAQLPTFGEQDVLMVGPGLGQARWGQKIYQAVSSLSQRTLWDADALGFLAKKPRPLTNAILTPHPKEAAQLLGWDLAQVQADRWQTVQALVEKYQCVVVLKGAGTWVAAPEQTPWLCPHGNSAMAVGGMGDVLSGIIAAIWAQGVNAFEAACLGVALHGQSADEQVKYYRYGLTPLNVIEGIRLCLPDVSG